ncbi:MAG: beta-L-arabinofuranosidase domain-containing protein [Alistipes sp.]
MCCWRPWCWEPVGLDFGGRAPDPRETCGGAAAALSRSAERRAHYGRSVSACAGDGPSLARFDGPRPLPFGLPLRGGARTQSARYGGWESAGCSGHGFGHFLSAAAMMYAATGDRALLDKINYSIDGLAECQQKEERDCWPGSNAAARSSPSWSGAISARRDSTLTAAGCRSTPCIKCMPGWSMSAAIRPMPRL